MQICYLAELHFYSSSVCHGGTQHRCTLQNAKVNGFEVQNVPT